MSRRAEHVLFIIGLLLVLQPIALASPPDCTWNPGIYDDADFDDVVLVLTGSTPALTPAPGVDVRPLTVAVASAAPGDDLSAPAPALAGHASRAPPASS